MALFRKRNIPDGLLVRCEDCGAIILKKEFEANLRVCPRCNFHFTLDAWSRLDLLLDKDSFAEHDKNMSPADPLNFKGSKTYVEKVAEDQKATGLKDAALTGEGRIGGRRIGIAVTDSRFIMGSMGSVVGERITRTIEFATENSLPLIIASGSGGGARMYEGMLSLMQMAKTSAALSCHHEKGLFFLSILTNPTMAGVMASFASLGDLIMAEPKALIGFTGPRVIEQTLRQRLPDGFQKSEFLLEHGLIDMIVQRKDMKGQVIKLLNMFSRQAPEAGGGNTPSPV